VIDGVGVGGVATQCLKRVASGLSERLNTGPNQLLGGHDRLLRRSDTPANSVNDGWDLYNYSHDLIKRKTTGRVPMWHMIV
jgi:hypothetical protein